MLNTVNSPTNNTQTIAFNKQLQFNELNKKEDLEFIYNNFNFYGTSLLEANFSDKFKKARVIFLGDDHTSKTHCCLNSLFIEKFAQSNTYLLVESLLPNLTQGILTQWQNRMTVWELSSVRKRKNDLLDQSLIARDAIFIMRDCLMLLFNGSELVVKFNASVDWPLDKQQIFESLKQRLKKLVEDTLEPQLLRKFVPFSEQIQLLSDPSELIKNPHLLKNLFEACFNDHLNSFYASYIELTGPNGTKARGLGIAAHIIDIQAKDPKFPIFVWGGCDHFAPYTKEDKEAVQEMFNKLKEHQITYIILEPKITSTEITDLQTIEDWMPTEIQGEDVLPSELLESFDIDQLTEEDLCNLSISNHDLSSLSDSDKLDLTKLKYLNYFGDEALSSQDIYNFFDICMIVHTISERLIQESFELKIQPKVDCNNNN